jgi:hypothetical protein
MSALGRSSPIAEMQKMAKDFTVTITDDEFGGLAAAQQRRANGPTCRGSESPRGVASRKRGRRDSRKLAAADLKPVLYLATLLGVEPDVVLRLFVLLVAILLDPAAVLLLMAATTPIDARRGTCGSSSRRD